MDAFSLVTRSLEPAGTHDGRIESTSQAEYAGSIPVIGSTFSLVSGVGTS